MGHFLPFKPLIKSSICQTILGTTLAFEWEVGSKTHYVKLPDDDVLALEVTTPKKWKEDHWTIFLVHGLCGSHKSVYMKRLAKKFYKMGIRSVRVNLRGCGSGKGLARLIYHGGSSHDILEVLQEFQRFFPRSPNLLVGFSLGGNVSLKLAGELKDKGLELLKGVIAIGPPADLVASAKLFMHPKNSIYARYFLRLLLEDIEFRHEHFKDLPPHNLPEDLTLEDFNELYVAPRAKFNSALDYYTHCSAKRFCPDIEVPTKILFANDDPIIKSSVLDEIILPPHVEVYKTDYGGHIGFMGQNIFKEFRWMDHQICRWVEQFRS